MGNSMAGNLLPKQSPPLRECFADSAAFEDGPQNASTKEGYTPKN